MHPVAAAVSDRDGTARFIVSETAGESRLEREEEELESTPSNTGAANETLVVASKIKNYIREKSGMNTSAGVMDALSDRLRALCDAAIENARTDGRKTVMDRDFR